MKGFMQAEQRGKVVYQMMKGKLIKQNNQNELVMPNSY